VRVLSSDRIPRMPLAGIMNERSSTASQHSSQSTPGSESNAVPFLNQQYEGCQVSVKNTFIEVGGSPPSEEPLKRSSTDNNHMSNSSSSYDPPPLPLGTPYMQMAPMIMGMHAGQPMEGYPNPAFQNQESPVSRWYENSGGMDEYQQSSGCTDDGTLPYPGDRWPTTQEVSHGDIPWKQAQNGMGPEGPVPGQVYMTPFGQPMMCAPVQMTNAMGQPTVLLVPQHALMGWPQQQMNPETSQGDSQTYNGGDSQAYNAVYESMTAWKEQQQQQQSSVDNKKAFGKDRNPAYNGNWKETTPQFNTSSQNAARPRAKNAISKKPADTADSTGPRAVFVDLSKLIVKKRR